MDTIFAIIETPAQQQAKFNYDPGSGFFTFKKLLPAGMSFPFDFGFIPGTMAEDDDPLDIMVISEIRTFTGCRIECRVIGCIKALQTEKNTKPFRNDRIIAVPAESLMYRHINQLDDLPQQLLEELQAFFINYNRIEEKTFEVLGLLGPAEALNIIREARTGHE